MIRKAVGAIVFQGTEFLLVHKVKVSSLKNFDDNIKGEWDFPKGGVEEGDKDLKATILRELEEETGSTQYKIIKQLDEIISFPFDIDFAKKQVIKNNKQQCLLLSMWVIGLIYYQKIVKLVKLNF